MTATPQPAIATTIKSVVNGLHLHQPQESSRATVSAVLIVKNEEHIIEPCLASLVDWVDEIVVLDSGSTDRTVELATQYGAKVHVSEDWQGFGIQRQRAQCFATGDYVLAIDADERVSPDLRQSIELLLASTKDDTTPKDDTVYEVVRQNTFLDKTPYRNGWRRETLVRLYSRTAFAYCSSTVHESVDGRGASVERLHGVLIHDACRDYEYYLEKHLAYAHTWARERAAEGKSASIVAPVLHGLGTFARLFLLSGGFLDGRHGFLYAAHLGQYAFNKYAALWYYSRQHAKKADGE